LAWISRASNNELNSRGIKDPAADEGEARHNIRGDLEEAAHLPASETILREKARLCAYACLPEHPAEERAVVLIKPGHVIASKYRLERELARGGMGSLWVAFDRKLRRSVAIKFINSTTAEQQVEARLRFDREARAAAQIRSPHVVHIYDYGVDRDRPYLVMELLEGEDLGARLARERRLPVATVSGLLNQAAKGLDAVHAAGIIHRDLKPANVFLGVDGDGETVKLIDFGVARSERGDGRRSTRRGAWVGTLNYMAPEQALGEQPLDHRADFWSLAVIVYRLLTGKLPFEGDSADALILAICHQPVVPPSEYVSDLPASIDVFFERALARAPELRFHSARQMASSFAAALATARTITLPWGTPATRDWHARPRAGEGATRPDWPAAEGPLDSSRGSLDETMAYRNALPRARGILPSDYTPSSRTSPSRGLSRRRWWWAAIPAALTVVGILLLGIAQGTRPAIPIRAPAASASAGSASTVPPPQRR
jgi:serine/threonine protein kinase